EAAAGGCRGGVQPGQEAGDHQDAVARGGHARQHPGGVQAFQEHGAGGLVVVEQADRAVAVPRAQRDRFARALVVADLQLQHRRGAVRAVHRDDQGADAVQGPPGDAQLPALHERRGQPRQGGDEGAARLLVEPDLGGGQSGRDIDHGPHGSAPRRTRHRGEGCPCGSSTTCPVVARPSRARWAAAAPASGKRCTAGTRRPAAASPRARSSRVRSGCGPPARSSMAGPRTFTETPSTRYGRSAARPCEDQPKTTCRPPGASRPTAVRATSPPTPSYTTVTLPAWAPSRPAQPGSMLSTARSAPFAATMAVLAGPPARPITVAPAFRASCTSRVPRPPAAGGTRTTSSGP